MHSSRKANVAIGLLLTVLLICNCAYAQSGHSVMKGYVAFEGFNYVDKQPRAKVELRPSKESGRGPAVAQTSEHGQYEFNPAPLGECVLRISSPGFKTYEISVYIPSDFLGNLAIMMKRSGAKEGEIKK